jgi:hypothetical protein
MDPHTRSTWICSIPIYFAIRYEARAKDHGSSGIAGLLTRAPVVTVLLARILEIDVAGQAAQISLPLVSTGPRILTLVTGSAYSSYCGKALSSSARRHR